MKVGLSLIWDYKENGCCDIKKLRARLSENWEEINMDELTGIIDYGNFAIMPGHYINSRECVGMQLFIIETQGYEKYQQILNKCESYKINIALSFSSKTNDKNNEVFRVVLAHEYVIRNKFVINVAINMLNKILLEDNSSCCKMDHIYKGEENRLLMKPLGAFNINQLFYPLFDSFDRKSSFRRNYERFCFKNKILLINGCAAMGHINFMPSVLAENIDPTSIYIEGESTKTAIFMVSSVGQNNNVKLNNKIRRVEIEDNCECKLLHEFYDGNEIDDDILFLIFTNMINLYGGKNKFLESIETIYDIETVQKWKKYFLYYKNALPCNCSKELCPYFESCDNAGTIVSTLLLGKKIFKEDERFYSLDEASASLRNNLSDAIESCRQGIHLIKAQTAIGKTTTYIDLIYNDLERKYIIAVPTNILKKQVYKDLRYKGFCDEEIFMTSSITDSNLIPEEVKENIIRMHKIGIHNKTKKILLDYYKEIDENPSKVAIAEECKKIIEGVDAIKNQRVIVTTHAFLLNLPESFVKNYTIIIDEDILQLSFLNNAHSISENCLMSVIEKNIPVYSNIAREMLAEPLDVYKNIDKCKTNIQLNDDQLGDITFSENDNIFDLTKARTFVRIKDSDTKEIVLKYFCPRELASMKYIVLSATLNLNIYKKYFQDSMEVFLYPEMKAEYQGKLIQYTYHSLGRGDLANKKNVFDWLYDYAGCGELQVITFKGNRRLGNLSKMNKKGLHFGNTCGINAMTGMNIGIVGTPFKVEEAYKLIASYLGAEVNNKIDTFPRTHRVKYKGYSFLFITYSDPLLREIQLYSIESELEQCVGRARLLRKDCTVYLLSSFPCEQAELHIKDYLHDESFG